MAYAIGLLVFFVVLFTISRLTVGRDNTYNDRTYPHGGGMHEHFTEK